MGIIMYEYLRMRALFVASCLLSYIQLFSGFELVCSIRTT
jgi:hypothetical protein